MNKTDLDRIWELTVKKLHNSLDSTEEEELQGFGDLEESQKMMQEAKQVYSKSSNSFHINHINKEKNWKLISEKINKSKKIHFPVYLLKYAAVFAVALLIGIVAPQVINYKSSEVAYNKIEMDWGQMGKITLSDGTEVWLNAGTVLEYPTEFNSKERAVKLVGEAQFKVAHNSKVPFEVATNAGVVKVHGTTFNVAAYDEDPETTITLIEGKVSFENFRGDVMATLKPSEQLSINRNAGKAVLRNVETEFYSSWIDGKILLQETKLSDLVKILSRWYNVDIKLADEQLGDLKISGTIIKNKPLDLFLKIMERMYDVEYKLVINNNKKDEVLISKK